MDTHQIGAASAATFGVSQNIENMAVQVSVYSYAVMSNHTHIVLHVDPNEAQAWPDEEVARRWLAVFPGALRDAQSEKQKEYIVLGLRSDPVRLKEIRSRLGSLRRANLDTQHLERFS